MSALVIVAAVLMFAAFVFARVRALSRELAALSRFALADAGEPQALPELRFAESAGLGQALVDLRQLLRASQRARATQRQSLNDAQGLRARFIASMGHDLRSPLNAMIGFADLVALDPAAALHEQQQRSVEIIRERGRDLLALIDDMVDWARLEAGELKLAPVPCDASSLIEDAVARAKQRSGARGLSVELSVEGPLGTLNADGARIVQALLGLMDHAARMDANARLVVIARRVPAERAVTSMLRIEIQDPQLQIREADRVHFFEAFRPSFAPSGKRIAGLSLGTALARALSRAQGGDVWFDSRPERGTTFVLTMPS